MFMREDQTASPPNSMQRQGSDGAGSAAWSLTTRVAVSAYYAIYVAVVQVCPQPKDQNVFFWAKLIVAVEETEVSSKLLKWS